MVNLFGSGFVGFVGLFFLVCAFCVQKSLNTVFVVIGLLCGCMEEFVVRVFKGGKVTVPKRLRDLFGVEDGDYVRLVLVEVLKRQGEGWVRRKVE